MSASLRVESWLAIAEHTGTESITVQARQLEELGPGLSGRVELTAFHSVMAATPLVAASTWVNCAGTGTTPMPFASMYSLAVPSTGPPKMPASVCSVNLPSTYI